METNIISRYATLKSQIQPLKARLTTAERNRFQNLKAMFRNIADDGFVGGESGCSESAAEKGLQWLESLTKRLTHI